MVANFSMVSAVWFFTELDVLISMAATNRKIEAQHGADAVARSLTGQEAVRGAIVGIDHVETFGKNVFETLKNGHIDNAWKRLRSWGQNEARWDELFNRACALRDAVRIETQEYVFYVYPKEKGHKLLDWKPYWETTTKAFPDVRIDCYCATDCYGLGHNTASVFHSMRVAEVGLRALANERRVKLPRNKAVEWGTWQEIIKALDDEIKLIGQTWKAGKRKDAALEFYSGARTDLNGFKDEYRNLVSHVRMQYDEFQALRALTRVHEFMGRLAEKLDHKHHRITWGRFS